MAGLAFKKHSAPLRAYLRQSDWALEEPEVVNDEVKVPGFHYLSWKWVAWPILTQVYLTVASRHSPFTPEPVTVT